MTFKKHCKKCIALFLAVLIIIACTTSCGKSVPNDENTITVALFPYVPDLEAMQEILTEQWGKISDTPLTFVDWDCYYDSDPDDIDVYMYDAMFLDSLVENGYSYEIAPSDIENADSIIESALEGAMYNDKYYGIPSFMCANFMIYYTDDTEIANVDNVHQLYQIVGDKKTDDRKPLDKNDGIITNFFDNFMYFYLESLLDTAGEYHTFPQAPDLKNLNEDSVEVLKYIAKMSGQENVLSSALEGYVYGSYGKAEWFNEGLGRCLIGFSETMTFLPDIIDKISVKPIAMSDGSNIKTYYCDYTSINKKSVTDEDELKECLRLVNLLASEEFLKAVTINEGKTQYVLPVRASVYDYAADTFPMYTQLKELVLDEDNEILRFGTSIYDYQNDSFKALGNSLK